MVIFTETSVTLLSAAVLAYIIFSTTEWWEILSLVIGLAFMAYMAPSIIKEISM